jgi:hypothetical protein
MNRHVYGRRDIEVDAGHMALKLTAFIESGSRITCIGRTKICVGV